MNGKKCQNGQYLVGAKRASLQGSEVALVARLQKRVGVGGQGRWRALVAIACIGSNAVIPSLRKSGGTNCASTVLAVGGGDDVAIAELDEELPEEGCPVCN